MKSDKVQLKFLVSFFFFVALCFLCGRLYFNLTDDFRLGNITFDLPLFSDWQVPPLTVEEEQQLNHVLAQNFYYIGKGAQSYVFGSEDGRYVLKFFKTKHFKPSLFNRLIPSVGPFAKYLEANQKKREMKFVNTFQGYKLAYDLHKQETGLIYVQLNPSHVLREVNIFDKLGLKRTINLGEVFYVVQKKGKTFRTVLTDLLEKGEVELAKKRISQIFDLYSSEYKKGIYDRDHGVMHNTGFIEDQAFHLDVGKLTLDESIKQEEMYAADIEFVAAKILSWLQKNFSCHTTELSVVIHNKLQQMKALIDSNAGKKPELSSL